MKSEGMLSLMDTDTASHVTSSVGWANWVMANTI